MADKTKNYGLTKPSAEEFYDVQVQNDNMDIIDKTLKEHTHTADNVGALRLYKTFTELGLSDNDFSATDLLSNLTKIYNAMSPYTELRNKAADTVFSKSITEKLKSDLMASFGSVTVIYDIRRYGDSNPMILDVVIDFSGASTHQIYTCVFNVDGNGGNYFVTPFAQTYNPVGFFPKTGGTLTGDVTMKQGSGNVSINLVQDELPTKGMIEFQPISGKGTLALRNYASANEQCNLQLNSPATELSKMLRLTVNGTDSYNIYGEHNLPNPASIKTEKYTGNGNFGTQNPNSLTFSTPTMPYVIIISSIGDDGGQFILTVPHSASYVGEQVAIMNDGSIVKIRVNLTVGSSGAYNVSWYNSSSAKNQFNISGKKYTYTALF